MNHILVLRQQLESGIKEIDQSDKNTVSKCSAKIKLCQDLNNELRKYYCKNSIREQDQITFFKEIKPQFVSALYFHIEVFNYLKGRPKGSLKAKKQYINLNLDRVSTFITRHSEFHHYIQLGSTHFDEIYFKMINFDPLIHGNLEYPVDPIFSSPAEPTLSCLLASDRFIQFLKNEYYTLRNPTLDPTWETTKSLKWNRSKTDLVELVYAMSASNSINGELKDIIEVAEKVFNLDLGNFYRTYTDIKYKKDPTSLLNDMKKGLLEKISSENQ
ncbi:RteC domain-containing protein [Reichenbachiella agariperforans]|uniref:RteC domain-containing protein n=1 Tax=Reichenbachiella agariperforans TaxID=156994 RepID=UPI001C088DB5|nr:RteC domain-containing protein [Reichenbachiella agariperforans]MBU2912695.1 RteC domain-containing protein [Reichenbachiella agariperforans]